MCFRISLSLAGLYSEQISKMERLAKVVNNWKTLTIFAKCSILEVWHGSEYASGIYDVLSANMLIYLVARILESFLLAGKIYSHYKFCMADIGA